MIAYLNTGHSFFVVTRNTEFMENIPYNGILPNAWINDQNCRVFYFSKNFLSIQNIYKLLKTTKPDAVYINGIYSWYFSILPIILSKLTGIKKIIVAPRGMLSQHAISIKKFRKKIFLKLAYSFGLYKDIIFHSTNEAESIEIKAALNSKIQIKVAQNLPKISLRNDYKGITKKRNTLKLIFPGRISPEKNTLFAIKSLKNLCFNIEFDIYGSIYNSDYWNECKELISQMPANIKIRHFEGVNPHEILEKISNYHFTFLPTTGENFGHSIIESFLVGVPVIISKNTPWINLNEKNAGWDLDLNFPEQFSETIKYCGNMEDNEYRALKTGSRKLYEYYIQNSNFEEQYKKLFVNEPFM